MSGRQEQGRRQHARALAREAADRVEAAVDGPTDAAVFGIALGGSAVIVWSLVFQAALLAPAAIGTGVDAATVAADELGEESPSGIHLSEGHGSSMAPTMPAGDGALCVEWVPFGEGDVVAVDTGRYDGATVRHRVVEDRGETVVTKGDGNAEPDPPVDREDVVCRVVYSENAGVLP